MDDSKQDTEDAPAAAAPSEGSTVERVVLPKPAERRPCPLCLELIRPDARKCPHCQEYLDPALRAASRLPPPVSRMAAASLVLGLFSPLLLCTPAPLAVLFGIGGLVSGRGGRRRGRGMALAGLVLGAVWCLALVLVVATVVREAGDWRSLYSAQEPLF